MVPPSAPRTNRTLSEMVPERCLTLALERLLARRPGLHPRQSGRARRNGPRSIPRQVPQCVGSALQLFPLPSERRHDQKSGNESSGQDFRSTRPSLAVNYMAHVADSQRFLLQGPLCSRTSARADSQKRRSPVSFRIASRARKWESCGRGGRQCWCFLTRTSLLMRNRIDIDPKHSRAIVQEIGERLRVFLKEEPELPGSLRAQIDRLREWEEQSPSIIPSAERWDKLHR